ncbi:MAG: SDR family oxidoreductase [Chloroflexota bacterium]
MKLVVFGAQGGIGRQVVEQALTAGHTVTAVVRRPSEMTLQHERLEIVKGDVLEPASIQAAIAGKDAVVSALGIKNRAPTTVYSQGVANIIQAMNAAHVRRLMCISASGLDPGPLWQRVIAKPLLWMILKEMYSDLARMETVVKASNLDWTIMRPPQFTDGPHTGRYQTSVNQHLARGRSISRADIADYIVTHLDDRSTYRAWTEMAY